MADAADLPTLPLTIHIGPDGRITTGHPLEDERLANGIVMLKEHAKQVGRPFYVYEHPEHGLEVSPDDPQKLNCVKVFPGGRTVFQPARQPRNRPE